MKISDIMVQHVVKVKENASVQEVLERFAEHKINGLPVVNERNEIVAFISTHDMIRYLDRRKPIIFPTFRSFHYSPIVWFDEIALEHKLRHLTDCNVMEVAIRDFPTISHNALLKDVATVFKQKNISHLPVERDGILVGIVNRSDMIKRGFHVYGDDSTINRHY
ncbi:CBS domain-containing protein [Paenibacillus elgii]|uniref:CBS domain-containing protein n=1 Tax=Paenibacillus elgii TaxID=189691 RepID=UPI002D7C64E2|nr:CBS domain-containing protein [Paenibacillus elgii]